MNTASALPVALRIAALGGALLALAGCAATAGSPAPTSSNHTYTLGSTPPSPPTGEVVATGTVIDTDGDVKLCLGIVMESYPPQCIGVPVTGWSWSDVQPDDESGTTRWGTYGMSGTYDGTSFTPKYTPISLALFDTIARPDPVDGATGTNDEKELVQVQEQVSELLGTDVLSSGADRGYLWVDVVWDDGTLQQAADADFGPGVVVIRSALWQVTG